MPLRHVHDFRKDRQVTLREQLPSEDSAVVDALQIVSQLALGRRTVPDPGPFVPTRWGHLNVLGVIHRGDDTQYAARDDALGREVVLTLIGPLNGDAKRTEQLLQQMRHRTRVTHPNLAIVFGADYAQDRVGFWTERVDGRSLAEIVADGARYGISQACQTVLAVCGAVGALHTAGLANGGIAAAQVVESTDHCTVLLASVCSPVDADPSLPSCSREADVFDLGALLVLLLSGIQIQEPADPAALVDRLRQIRPDVRPSLTAVIARCLSPDPQRRFPSAVELEQAIRTAMTDSPVTAEWVIGFSVTALVMVLLLWYALVVH
jgi:eukaryotic-like serine/threonine-protein kinase